MSDAITVLSDDLRDNVTGEAGRIGPNVHAIELRRHGHITPAPRENRYREEFGLTGKTVVMYAGNVGFSQSLDLVLDAAAALAHDPDLVFVINGGGAAPGLERSARTLANVRSVDMQPKDRLPEGASQPPTSTWCPLRRGLAVERPVEDVLDSGLRPSDCRQRVDIGTEVAAVVERANAGIAVPLDDPGSVHQSPGARLVADPDEAERMGRSGRIRRTVGFTGGYCRALRSALFVSRPTGPIRSGPKVHRSLSPHE